MRVMLSFVLVFFLTNTYARTPEKLFYVTQKTDGFRISDKKLADIKNHAAKMTMIAPQIYALDKDGHFTGKIDPQLVAVAAKKHLKLLPLIINQGFDQEKVHQFLQSPAAQAKAITSLLVLCKQYGFYGIQFDIENINVADKENYSQFIQRAAMLFHQQGFNISVAIVPHSMTNNTLAYDSWYADNWSGAYDYEALAKSADFLTLMAYDQHTSLTTPGPIAAFDWVLQCLRLMLRTVPAEKISLGIPTYSGHWSTGSFGLNKLPDKYVFRSKETQISYADVRTLLKANRATLLWQSEWKTAYSLFSCRHKNEYLFVENAKSFQAKWRLAKRYHLRGISVWQLGLEDPAIWRIL